MAKKELTEEDIIKKQYTQLNKINQRLKNVSDGYYISYDGTIYMSSLVSFIEKFIKLHKPEDIEKFHGCMILPNEFFQFSKNAKKTLMTASFEDNKFKFGQTNDDQLSLVINKYASNEEGDKFIKKSLIDEKENICMYKRFFQLEELEFNFYNDKDNFHELTEEEVFELYDSKPIELEFNGTELILTKHLLLDIKKSDSIGIARYGFKCIDEYNKRVVYMIKHTTDLYDSYTIFNTLQN